MKKPFLIAFVAMFAAAPLTAAHAVDAVNTDGQDHVLLVSSDDGAKQVEIGAGQTIKSLCKACEITIGDQDPVSAEGDEVVSIKGGKASVGG